jgi:hypothetical protein
VKFGSSSHKEQHAIVAPLDRPILVLKASVRPANTNHEAAICFFPHRKDSFFFIVGWLWQCNGKAEKLNCDF